MAVARRNFPKQFLHYHCAGHGAVITPRTQRGCTAFVHTKISRVIGASGHHVGTMSSARWRMMPRTRTSPSCFRMTPRVAHTATRSGRARSRPPRASPAA